MRDGTVLYADVFGPATPESIEPGVPYRYTIELGATSQVFRRGHAIRLEVSSSNFPRFDRNQNVFEPLAALVAGQSAIQTILHDAAHPSRLILPVVPIER